MSSKLSPESAQVVRHIKNRGACTLIQLLDQFKQPAAKMSQRLYNLCTHGYLVRDTSSKPFRFSVPPAVDVQLLDQAKVSRPKVQAVDPAPEEADPVEAKPTPPAQYNIMRATVWRTPAMPAGRAGAQDFAACPSIHHGRELPYKPPSSGVHCG